MILGERFFKMSNAIFCYDLTPIQFVVYSYLVSLAGQKEKCWPSVKTIAANCGCSKTSVREAVQALEQKRLIRRVETYREDSIGRTHQTNNTYFILPLPPFRITPQQILFHGGPPDGGEIDQQDAVQQMKSLPG